MNDKQRSPYPLAVWTGIFLLFTVYAWVTEAQWGLPDWMVRGGVLLATLFLLAMTIVVARSNED